MKQKSQLIKETYSYQSNIENDVKGVKEIEQLSPEKVLEQWSKTYNKNGKPDWSHIIPYYHPDIIFMDSIQKIEGMEDFKAMCARLTKRCRQLEIGYNVNCKKFKCYTNGLENDYVISKISKYTYLRCF